MKIDDIPLVVGDLPEFNHVYRIKIIEYGFELGTAMVNKGWMKVLIILAIFPLDCLSRSMPAFAQQDAACAMVMMQSREKIISIGAVVSEIVNGTNDSPSNPFQVNQSVTFRVGSLGASNVATKKSADLMSSPSIQSSIARRVFASCPMIVEINFNLAATDWVVSYFRGQDGRLIPGTCITPGPRTNPLRWGEYECL